jgi:hypothetical protein
LAFGVSLLLLVVVVVVLVVWFWRQETGDRRQETGDRRQETGDRRQETGDRRQETGDRIFLFSPGCPGSYFIDQVGLVLTKISPTLPPKCWD